MTKPNKDQTQALPQSSQEENVCEGGCDCGDGIDMFGMGDLLDYHMDVDMSEEELAKKLEDAINSAKKIGGTIPGGLEAEIGSLSAPKITWQDFVRNLILKKKSGSGRNDWTRVKSRPLFAGLYLPQKKNISLRALIAYDCSGSMSADDVAFGLSQLLAIGKRDCELLCVAWDTIPYFSHMVRMTSIDKDKLVRLKRVGLGGTEVSSVFNEYEDYCDDVDLIVIISDCFLSDTELKGAKIPKKGTEVLWLSTSSNGFKPPFGRLINLRNE